jgi:mono/diheme cytochrome c family protein
MKKTLAAVVVLMAGICWVAASAQRPVAPTAGSAQVERGRYLVEDVAMCGECHSPRDDQGQPDHSRWLGGAPLWFTPNQTYPDWAFRAPPLAGQGSFTDADMTMVLEKGLQPTGRAIRPPMHVYHMSHDDAAAIMAYLKSLPPVRQ